MNPQAPHWIALIQMYTRKRITPATPNLKGQQVHLWNDYKQGRKPTSGTWEVRYHWIISTPHSEREILLVREKDYSATLNRLRTQICTQAEYDVYIGSLNTRAAAA